MVYELRRWFDQFDCLYTDDQRVRDMALRSPDLQIAARYFRAVDERQPFAWDIVGPPDRLAVIATTFGKRVGLTSASGRR